MTAGGIREKELRLALVCYGGVSLAVYMHGISKEVWHVARASRMTLDGAPAAGGTAAVYAGLLDEMAAASGTRVRVLVDILAGASAGGINAIFLAQAISGGQSLDPLTDLWLDGADVEALIDEQAAPASRFSKVWALPLAWMAAGRTGEQVEALDEATRAEVRAKLSHFVRSRWFEPPFSGAGFTTMLLDAFAAMAASPAGPRLLPDRQPLDLFVTVTDFTGHPERLRLNSPPEVIETEHRMVIGFTDEHASGAPLGAAPEFAFAARATSSFPGAFPPFTVAELDTELARRDEPWPGRAAFLQRILPRQSAARGAEQVVLIDGSVLANAPFGPAIEALRERPARREVDRRFIYIDPAPGVKVRLAGTAEGVPGFFQTILGAVSELPRKQPIRDNLDAIARRSERIARMQRVLAAIRPEVEVEVERLFGRTLFLNRPTPARLAAWRARAQEAAAAGAGYGYVAYGNFKMAGVVETISNLLHAVGGEPGPQRWRRIRQRIDDALLGDGGDLAALSRTGARTVALLRTFDLGYRIRRLRLLARRLSEIEQHSSDQRLHAMRDAIYGSLARYVEKKRAHAHAALAPMIRSLGSDAGPLLDALAASLDLTTLDRETDARLAEALASLDKPERRALLLRYLGFPYLDVATLPLIQGEDADEYDSIRVDRISPDDARSIRGGGAEATLKGIQFNTFGAFFSRAYRENDYLWGRLHGAERMIDIIVSTLDGDARLPAGRIAALKRDAFRAILDEEQPRLSKAAALIATLRGEIG